MGTSFRLLKCIRTHYGRHCEPFSGQNALDYKISHILSKFFWGDTPVTRRSAPGAWTQTPISHCYSFTKRPLAHTGLWLAKTAETFRGCFGREETVLKLFSFSFVSVLFQRWADSLTYRRRSGRRPENCRRRASSAGAVPRGRCRPVRSLECSECAHVLPQRRCPLSATTSHHSLPPTSSRYLCTVYM